MYFTTPSVPRARSAPEAPFPSTSALESADIEIKNDTLCARSQITQHTRTATGRFHTFNGPASKSGTWYPKVALTKSLSIG